MKKVSAYKYVDEAISALDNGGRFYNVLTKANDGIISQAELGKVGGVFSDKQKMILFLEMAMFNLNDSQKKMVFSKLESKLQNTYKKFRPSKMLPFEANNRAKLTESAIITGVAKWITSKTDFNGFIMIPIVAGKVTTFTMVPLIDAYDVYEMRDHSTSEVFLIAHARSKEKLPEAKIQVAGIFKELKTSKDEDFDSKLFLEALYYSDISKS
ncbi:hypothetical protein [uncultured Algibacter sp.]|uniref:hypothetical protein n=1 Tax=uncultured Algibacter sp. TaxID=298659 RepID=UPI00260AFA7B|nr:hypothetical protein [uncultured Algibacter sp.]